MKKLTLILVILALISQSCKKEKVEPILDLYYGTTLDQEMIPEIETSAINVMTFHNDTIWPTDLNGNELRLFNPVTGQWNYIMVITVEMTVAQELVNIAYISAEKLIQERDRTKDFFHSNPDIIINIKFYENNILLERNTEDGLSFSEKIRTLNNVRQMLVDNKDKRLSEIIDGVHEEAQSIWIKICQEYLIYKILHPQEPQKSASNSTLDETKLRMISNKIIELIQNGEEIDLQKLSEYLK